MDSTVSPASLNSGEDSDKDSDCLEHLKSRQCAVCSDKAHSCNFGVITCESCKAFFRRNGRKTLGPECKRRCNITVSTRAQCRFCRRSKCLEVGMRPELIMTDEQRLQRLNKIESNRRRREKSLSVPSTPASTSSSSEPSSTECTPPFKVSRSPQPCDSGAPYPLFYNSIDLKEYELLSPSSRALLSTLCRASQHTCDIPLSLSSKIDQTKMYSQQEVPILMLVSMSKRIPAFRSLPQNDQVHLLQCSTFEAIHIGSTRAFDPVIDGWHVYTGTTEKRVVSGDILKATEKGRIWYDVYRDFSLNMQAITAKDPTIIMCLIALVIFSPVDDIEKFKEWNTIQEQFRSILRALQELIELRYPNRRVKMEDVISLLFTARSLRKVYDRAFENIELSDVSPLVIEILKKN